MDHPLPRQTAFVLFAMVVVCWGLNWGANVSETGRRIAVMQATAALYADTQSG